MCQIHQSLVKKLMANATYAVIYLRMANNVMKIPCNLIFMKIN